MATQDLMAIQDLMLGGAVSKGGVSLSYVDVIYIFSGSVNMLYTQNIFLVFLQCFKTVCVPTDLEPVISMYYMLLCFFFLKQFY